MSTSAARLIRASVGKRDIKCTNVASCASIHSWLLIPVSCVRRNQDVSLKIGSGFAPSTSFEVRARRLGMKLLPRLPGSQLVMKLAMRGIREAAWALELPPATAATER